jgi:hypothetical protein
MSDENKPKKVGSLIEAEQKSFDELQNFMFIIWTVNPTKNMCRVIINDGSIKLWLNRDKFIKIMTDLLGPTTHELEYTLFRIKQSMSSYGGWFYYDRIKNDFREVNFQVDLEHINPMELIAESRQSLVKEKITDHFKEINNEYDEKTKGFTQPAVKPFNRFINVIRNFNGKRNKVIK